MFDITVYNIQVVRALEGALNLVVDLNLLTLQNVHDAALIMSDQKNDQELLTKADRDFSI